MYKKLVLMGIVTLGLVAGSAQAELVGHWRLNEGAGSIAYDSSGNGNDGTIEGEPEWVAGVLGGALLLDGVDDYVEIPHSEILTVDDEVTVMAWINAARHEFPGAGYQGIIAKSNGPRSYSLYVQGAGTLHFSTAGVGSSSSETIPLNEWVHVAAQVVGGEHRYFLNGEPAGGGGSGIALPGTADTANVLIGNTWEADREFGGMIDDARGRDRASGGHDGYSVPAGAGSRPGGQLHDRADPVYLEVESGRLRRFARGLLWREFR